MTLLFNLPVTVSSSCVIATTAMMFGVDLNMSPRQDDDWELDEPEEPDLNWLPQ